MDGLPSCRRFRKALLLKCFLSALKRKATPAFSNSIGFKNVFAIKKLRFRDGLVWTVGLNDGIMLCFLISPV